MASNTQAGQRRAESRWSAIAVAESDPQNISCFGLLGVNRIWRWPRNIRSLWPIRTQDTCQFQLGPGMKFKVYLAELVNSKMALTNMLTVSRPCECVYLYGPPRCMCVSVCRRMKRVGVITPYNPSGLGIADGAHNWGRSLCQQRLGKQWNQQKMSQISRLRPPAKGGGAVELISSGAERRLN